MFKIKHLGMAMKKFPHRRFSVQDIIFIKLGRAVRKRVELEQSDIYEVLRFYLDRNFGHYLCKGPFIYHLKVNQ